MVLVLVISSLSLSASVVRLTGKTPGRMSSILGSPSTSTRRYFACDIFANTKIVATKKRILLVLYDISNIFCNQVSYTVDEIEILDDRSVI